jgi:hypothetical protein
MSTERQVREELTRVCKKCAVEQRITNFPPMYFAGKTSAYSRNLWCHACIDKHQHERRPGKVW